MIDPDIPKIRFSLTATSQCRVLVVEDDESVRARLQSLLKRSGYEVSSANSDEEALVLLDERGCDILLIDWGTPRIDGIALCRELRLREAERRIYTIILTGHSGEFTIVASLRAGADDCLSKSASSEELLARMEVGRRITRLQHSLRESNEENQRFSETDPLTGAHNRRFLTNNLPRELERSRRYLRPISILGCDLDDLKGINQRCGHKAGDQVLQAFVERVLGCIRMSTDWMARSGGDEFVIVLPETGLSGARCVAEKIRRMIATSTIATSSGQCGLTVSLGATALETTRELAETSMTELLRAVDKCLQSSKNLGHDRSTCAPIALASSVRIGSA